MFTINNSFHNNGFENRHNMDLSRKIANRRKRRFQLVFLAVLIVLLVGICVSVALAIKGQFNPNLPADGTSDAYITSDKATSSDINSEETDELNTGKNTGKATEKITDRVTAVPPSITSDVDTPVVSPGRKVICLDPGHGYDDPGTVSDYLKNTSEKEIVLDICFRIREILESRGYQVIMTRENDTKPSGEKWYLFNPQKRVEFFNSHSEIAYFISVHCNSFESDTSTRGTRIYYYENNNPKITPQLAQSIAQSIDKAVVSPVLARCFSMKASEAYYVCRKITVPSVLIETDFVTNPEAAALMLTEDWRQKMAQGISDGIVNYLMSVGGIS